MDEEQKNSFVHNFTTWLESWISIHNPTNYQIVRLGVRYPKQLLTRSESWLLTGHREPICALQVKKSSLSISLL